MEFEGTGEVLRHLFLKKTLLERGASNHNQIRPMLVVLSGSMRGVYGGGQVTALSDFGLRRVFNNAVGISTGAPTAAYFLTGQAREGTSIYYTECTQPHFISPWRMLRGGRVMDVDWLAKVFRGEIGNKTLAQNRLHYNRTKFWVIATEVKSGAMALLDAKSVSLDVIKPITASLAVPGISHGNVVIHGTRYCDGGCYPLPIRELISWFMPTDILVLANGSREYRAKERSLEPIIQTLMLWRYPREVRHLFATRHERFMEELDHLRTQQSCNWAILWSDDDIGSYTTDSAKLKAAALRAEEHLSLLLEEARAGVS